MAGVREAAPSDEPAVYWWGRSGDLVRRMQALADELHRHDRTGDLKYAAHLIREVLSCDYNPLPEQLPPLGDPLRKYSPGSRSPQSEPGS